MIRSPAPADSDRLLRIAVSTGLFRPEEAEALLGGVLVDLHAGRLGPGHSVRVWDDPARGGVVGWVYYAPAFKADGVWDLWWIGVDPAAHGTGVGDGLLTHVEGAARVEGGRLLVIETSATPPLARARRFYERRGYAACGRIPDFYGDGDDKVIFARRIGDAAPGVPSR